MRSLLADDEKIVRRIECGSVAERQTLEVRSVSSDHRGWHGRREGSRCGLGIELGLKDDGRLVVGRSPLLQKRSGALGEAETRVTRPASCES